MNSLGGSLIRLAQMVSGVGFVVLAALPAQTKIEFEGPISGFSGSQMQLFSGAVGIEAAGARIDADGKVLNSVYDLGIGTFVEVAAEAHSDGTIWAVKIEISDEKNPENEIVGVIGRVDPAAQSFLIGPVSISWNSLTKFKGTSRPSAGQFVEIVLQVSGGQLTALSVELEEPE